jgi:hypothetical protein
MYAHALLNVDEVAVGSVLANNTNDFFRHFVIHGDRLMQAHVFVVRGQRLQSTTGGVATRRSISQSRSTAGMHS